MVTTTTRTAIRVLGVLAGVAGVAFAAWVGAGFGSNDPRLIVGLALMSAAPGLVVVGAVLGLPWQ